MSISAYQLINLLFKMSGHRLQLTEVFGNDFHRNAAFAGDEAFRPRTLKRLKSNDAT